MSTGKVKNGSAMVQMGENTKCDDTSADFEKAIAATGFGWFNAILFLTTVPSVLASQFGTSALSYVFPAAQCDLSLSLEDRGLINAVVYIGMIISCFIWGSLVDVFGRRKILYISHLLDGIFVVMSAFSTSFSVLVTAKFFGGFVINGPSMALSPYLCEFHATQFRSKVPLCIGFLFSVGNIILPLLAWVVLPSDVKFTIYGDFELHAWNLFLLICTIPGIACGIGFFLLPESPKYLMSKGNNDKALNIFEKVYHTNTRQPKELYPFKKLKDETQIHQKERGLKQAWEQLRPLFSLKYLKNLVLVCSLIFFLMLCVNSLRLWLPQIFQIINDFESESVSFCAILENVEAATGTDASCSMNFDNSSVYINSIIVAATAVVGYVGAATCVNKVGKKKLLVSLGLVSGICISCIYFAPNTLVALVLLCIYLMCACICIDVIITIAVDLFPTSLRASALSLAFMTGRIGSVFGNLIFPILLTINCAGIFFTLGFISTGCAILSIFLPNTDFKALD